MINYITSKTNEKIKFINELNDAKVRNQYQLFIVEGFHLVEMALNKGSVKTIVALEPYKCDESIEQLIVTPEILAKLSSTKTPQGILAVCKMSVNNNLNFGNKVLYLDDIQDPGNLGTIIRTALAFNFNDIILSSNTCSIYNSKVIAASQGALFYENFINGNKGTLLDLKAKGYQIVVTHLYKSVDLNEYTPSDKQVIVMGNEAHGVSDEILATSSVNVKIDINNIESLNVGIAASIMMFDANNRKKHE